MWMYAVHSSFVFAVVVHGAYAGTPQENCALPAIQDMVRAASADELTSFLRNTLQGVPDSTLNEARASRDITIAIAAAWEQVLRATEAAAHPNPDLLRRWVDHVSDCVSVVAPSWWRNAVLRAHHTSDGLIGFPVNLSESPYVASPFPFHLQDRDLQRFTELENTDPAFDSMIAPQDASICKSREGWMVRLGAEECILGKDVIEELGSVPQRASVHMDEERLYIAFHHARCSPFDIACISRNNGKLMWTRTVWSNGNLYQHSGRGYHWVTISSTDTEIVLFGLGDFNAYIEGFRKLDGECTFRFGTVYGLWERKWGRVNVPRE